MTTNLTLITSIVLTAAMASAGTYYVTTHVDPGTDNPVETAQAQPSPTANQPAPVVVSSNSKPIEINIKTEVVERHRPKSPHNFRAEGIAAATAPQPHFGIYQGK